MEIPMSNTDKSKKPISFKKTDLGEVVFNCKETERTIMIKLTGEGPKIITNVTYIPPLEDGEEVPVTPVNQFYLILMDQLRSL